MSRQDDETPTLDDAEEAFERADVETALAICEGLMGDDEAHAEPDVLYLAAECLLELQEPQEAAHLVELALGQQPDDPVLIHTRGLCHFESGDLDSARRCFERAVAGDGDLGEALYYLGLLAEREGRKDEAARLFAEACDRDPENLAPPTEWNAAKVKEIFDEIVEEMPDPLGEWLAGLDVAVEEIPESGALRGQEGPISPLVHCLFVGGKGGEPEGEDPGGWLVARPDRVLLYRLNLGKSAHDDWELHHELLQALLWETMEFLHLDETHLAKLGVLEQEDDEDLHPVGQG
jgi:tetratricopeptide (TPR) repeat protein